VHELLTNWPRYANAVVSTEGAQSPQK
jgi:hypothetical protein